MKKKNSNPVEVSPVEEVKSIDKANNVEQKKEETASKTQLAETEKPSTPVEDAQKPKKKNVKLSIGNLSSLETLDKEVEQVKEKKFRSVEEISLEDVSKYWGIYTEKVESDIIKQSLKGAVLSLYNNFLNIKVASNLQRADIEKEKDLMIFIRESLNVKDLQLKIEVEAKAQDNKPVIKKNLTVKERYLQMREVNPKLTALQKRFSLMPDE